MEHIDHEKGIVYSDENKEPIVVKKHERLKHGFWNTFWAHEKEVYAQKELYKTDNGRYFIRIRFHVDADEVDGDAVSTREGIIAGWDRYASSDKIIPISEEKAREWFWNLETTTAEEYESIFDSLERA